MDSKPVRRRLLKELNDFANESPVNYCAGPVNEENIRTWQAIFRGPERSEYENGIFFMRLDYPKDYPFKPPRVRFLTPILHVNIDRQGHVNLDIFTHQWSPALTISKILLSIHSLLTDPNPDDPLVPELAKLYKADKKRYEDKVREHTKKHAIMNFRRYALSHQFDTPTKVYSLMRLSRRTIRNKIWYSNVNINEGIKSLPLPGRLKNYLMFCDGSFGY